MQSCRIIIQKEFQILYSTQKKYESYRVRVVFSSSCCCQLIIIDKTTSTEWPKGQIKNQRIQCNNH